MRISPTNKPLVFVSMGDPSGIGPEIIMKALASPGFKGLANFVIIADRGMMELAAGSAGNRRVLAFVTHWTRHHDKDWYAATA